MSPPATRRTSKRLSTSPVARAPAKRPDTRSTTRNPTAPIAISQPDEMDLKAVAASKRDKAKETDREENILTLYSDFPEDDDTKPPALDIDFPDDDDDAKSPALDTSWLDEAEYDDEEGDDDAAINLTGDEDDAGLLYKDSDTIIQFVPRTITDTIPDSLNRHVVSYNVRTGPTNLGDLSKFIEHWTKIAKDPSTFMDALRLMWNTHDDKPPILFLALDKDDNTVVVLHHFELFRCTNKPPQLAALADDRYDSEKAPQLVFLEASEICSVAEFSIPSKVSDADIVNLEPDGGTLVSPPRKQKHQSTLLLPLPWHWAPLFLEDSTPMPACGAHLSLVRLASSLQDHPAAHAIVQNFAWGLILRKSSKQQPAILAVPIRAPRLSPAIITWRNIALQGIFESVDLSDDTPLALEPRPKPVILPPDSAALGQPPSSQPVPLPPDSATFEQSPRPKPVILPPDSAALGQPPSSQPVNLPPDSATFEQSHRPSPAAAPPVSTETTLLLQANLASNQAMVHAMTTFFASKSQARPSEAMIDDDSVTGEGSARPSKFTARKAAPFLGWAGITPGHLFKSLPTLFPDLVEGSSTERHGIITGFFCVLEKENPRTFAGFQPSVDLLEDIAKLKLAPPQGYGEKWHRGVGPMAFAVRSLADLDQQTENRNLRATYSDHLRLTLADVKKLESSTPLVPTDFEAFLLLLNRFADFHLAAFGPACDLYRKSSAVLRNLTSLRQRIARSPEFMTNRAPSIIWALTIATQEFFADTATATQFDRAKAMESDPPFVTFNLDVNDLSKLCVTEACDLPAFLRRLPPLSLPPAGPSPYQKQTPNAPKAQGGPAPSTAKNKSKSNSTPSDGVYTNPNFNAAFQAQLRLLPPGTSQEKVGLRGLLAHCPGSSYSTIMTSLGTDNRTCLRYHVLGACGLRGCTKKHEPVIFPQGGPAAVCTMLQPGFAALLATP